MHSGCFESLISPTRDGTASFAPAPRRVARFGSGVDPAAVDAMVVPEDDPIAAHGLAYGRALLDLAQGDADHVVPLCFAVLGERFGGAGEGRRGQQRRAQSRRRSGDEQAAQRDGPERHV